MTNGDPLWLLPANFTHFISFWQEPGEGVPVEFCCDPVVNLTTQGIFASKQGSDTLHENGYYFIQILSSVDFIETEFDIIESP
jgi:hypothetical protein